MTPDELLTTTRTVRKRLDLDRPVPPELVEECLRIALQAPTGGNAQRWHWVVVTDVDKRAAVGELYRRSTERYLASGTSAASLYADDPARAAVQQRVGDSAAYLGQVMGRVPVLVIPCLETTLPEGNQAGTWGSLLPAVWSYMLAARARGLGPRGRACTCGTSARSPRCSASPTASGRARSCRRRTTPARRSAPPPGSRSRTCCT